MAGLPSRRWLERNSLRLVLFALIFLITGDFLFWKQSIAAQLGTRSIAIGSSQPSVVTTHTFNFMTTTAGNIGSIQFDYCTNGPFFGTPCTAPSGMSVSSATIN